MARVTPTIEQILTAYHEAAHAVASESVGWGTASLRMTRAAPGELPPSALLGEHLPDMRRVARQRLNPEARGDLAMFIKLAPGPVEYRLCQRFGWADLDADDDECEDWEEVVWDLLSEELAGATRLSERSISRLRRAEERARLFVADETNWRAIQAVADSLLDACVSRGEWGLAGAQVRAIIEQSHVIGTAPP